MGAADVVPGVSGGTIALIAGIYEELIDTIAGFNLKTLSMLKRDGIIATWQKSNASFLVCVLAGIITSILSLSQLIRLWLETHPLTVWGFFFGLVVASIWFLAKRITKRTPVIILTAFVGCMLGICVSLLPAQTTSTALPLHYVFFCGMLAICAMILPGISGSFILLILGAYQPILEALHAHNIWLILSFIAGAIVGILVFSRVLKWLFAHFHQFTIALLTGFIAGSLVTVWPWNHPIASADTFTSYVLPIVMMLIGFGVVFSLERLGKAKN